MESGPDREPAEQASGSFSRHWLIVTLAGLLGMTYYKCCIFGAPRTKFLLELGATPFDFGLISGLTSLSLVFQLFAGVWANRVRRRKPIWMALFICHRLVFAGVLAAPMLFTEPRVRIWWIIGVLCVHNSLTHLGDPLWFSWMSDLVPKHDFNRHWAARQRFITAGSIALEIFIALWFNLYEQSGQVIRGFIILGITGLALGIVDILMFAAVPEPAHDTDPDIPPLEALTEPLRNREFRPFLRFRAYWSFAIMLGAPFFHPYLMSEMGINVLTLQLLIVVHSAGMVAASGIWGEVCDSHGYTPVLKFVVLFKFVVPLTYLLLPPVPGLVLPVLSVMFFFDGMLNAAGGLAVQGFCLRMTPRRNRAMYVAKANFLATGLAGGCAALIAGSLIKPLTGIISVDLGPYRFTGYHAVFLVSAILRALSLPLVARLHEPESQTMRDMLSHIRTVGLFGLRSPQR